MIVVMVMLIHPSAKHTERPAVILSVFLGMIPSVDHSPTLTQEHLHLHVFVSMHVSIQCGIVP